MDGYKGTFPVRCPLRLAHCYLSVLANYAKPYGGHRSRQSGVALDLRGKWGIVEAVIYPSNVNNGARSGARLVLESRTSAPDAKVVAHLPDGGRERPAS